MARKEATTVDATGGTPVVDLSYTDASRELDEIVAFFEGREVDVDQLVVRLERATAIVDELDRRLRRTRTQVEELVPRLAAATAAYAGEEPAGEEEEAEPDEPGDRTEQIDEVDGAGDRSRGRRGEASAPADVPGLF